MFLSTDYLVISLHYIDRRNIDLHEDANTLLKPKYPIARWLRHTLVLHWSPSNLSRQEPPPLLIPEKVNEVANLLGLVLKVRRWDDGDSQFRVCLVCLQVVNESLWLMPTCRVRYTAFG